MTIVCFLYGYPRIKSLIIVVSAALSYRARVLKGRIWFMINSLIIRIQYLYLSYHTYLHLPFCWCILNYLYELWHMAHFFILRRLPNIYNDVGVNMDYEENSLINWETTFFLSKNASREAVACMRWLATTEDLEKISLITDQWILFNP